MTPQASRATVFAIRLGLFAAALIAFLAVIPGDGLSECRAIYSQATCLKMLGG